MSDTEWKVTEEQQPGAARGALLRVEVASADGEYTAWVKWDGCVEIHETQEGADGWLHLCGARDLDAMIERLVKLRNLAREKFAGHWYGEWVTPDTPRPPAP